MIFHMRAGVHLIFWIPLQIDLELRRAYELSEEMSTLSYLQSCHIHSCHIYRQLLHFLTAE
jgi:hypothetical protein